jgi:UDP-N-acetyl-2-amino-2-deoxyglucuronate dehydrogenase
MKKFALIGAAGYIAVRHMQAIKETGNLLVSAMDPNDSVGVIDNYFPDATFFTEFEQFDRHIDVLRRDDSKNAVDYISICSPNYLHDSHMRFALRSGADAICEKPIVLNPQHLEDLLDVEKDSGNKINTILQLRLHHSIIDIAQKVKNNPTDTKYDVDLVYVTSRGKWYLESWKGNTDKSGGIATNIGVHFFDMLHFLFGELQESKVYLSSNTKTGGYLEYENARVRWFLSLDEKDVPQNLRDKGQRTYRSITINGEEIEFSGGFTDLHTRSYQEVLAGRGFGLSENRSAVAAVSAIRVATPTTPSEAHPLLMNALKHNPL